MEYNIFLIFFQAFLRLSFYKDTPWGYIVQFVGVLWVKMEF